MSAQPIDPASQVGRALLEALRAASPTNTDAPRWVTLAEEARRRGKSTSALRDWCFRHGVPIREESHRDAWVSPADVDRVIEGLPLATRAPSRETKSETDAEVERALEARDRRR